MYVKSHEYLNQINSYDTTTLEMEMFKEFSEEDILHFKYVSSKDLLFVVR